MRYPASITRAVLAVVGATVRGIVVSGASVTVVPRYDGTTMSGKTVVETKVISGEGDRLTSYPVIRVSVFSPKFIEAERVAHRVEVGLMEFPLYVEGAENSVLIDSVSIISSTAEVDWDVDGTRRFDGIYSLVIRR